MATSGPAIPRPSHRRSRSAPPRQGLTGRSAAVNPPLPPCPGRPAAPRTAGGPRHGHPYPAVVLSPGENRHNGPTPAGGQTRPSTRRRGSHPTRPGKASWSAVSPGDGRPRMAAPTCTARAAVAVRRRPVLAAASRAVGEGGQHSGAVPARRHAAAGGVGRAVRRLGEPVGHRGVAGRVAAECELAPCRGRVGGRRAARPFGVTGGLFGWSWPNDRSACAVRWCSGGSVWLPSQPSRRNPRTAGGPS